MASVTSIPVSLGPRSYSLAIGREILPQRVAQDPVLRGENVRALIVADSKLKGLARALKAALGSRCAGLVFLKGGERTKDYRTLLKLYAEAARAKLDRHCAVVAVGGGVIGDAVGFFAATYLRGLRVVHVPTTLVAQVDSAIGGKTAVNLPCGKNLVGAFHQPSLVAIDTTTLRTLPEREFRAGLAEVIKYGVIADPALFRRLEMRMGQILRREPSELAWVISQCCAIKARVVSQDERETSGLRAMLNFGHTLGHGIEAASHYRLLHGEAVGLGMIGAAMLSTALAGLPQSDVRRIVELVESAGLPVRLPRGLSLAKVLAAMRLDKKSVKGQFRFVLAKRIGAVATGVAVSEEMASVAIRALR